MQNIKPGKYKISKSLSNNELVNLLRSGNQTVVSVTFNNLRNKEDFAGNDLSCSIRSCWVILILRRFNHFIKVFSNDLKFSI